MNNVELVRICTDLAGSWKERNKEFKAMYKLLTLDDSLVKKEGMEFMVSNEPATFFNMALHVLTPNPMNHKVVTYGMTEEEVASTSQLEVLLTKGWRYIERERRQCGKESWYREVMMYLALYGWYSVFRMATDDGFVADVFDPATVYPEFSDYKLNRVCRVIPISKDVALKMAQEHGWALTDNDLPRLSSNINLYDYWEYVGGRPTNTIGIGDKIVKPSTPITWDDFIPVEVGTVNGLKVSLEISSGKENQKNMGRGILATNKDLYHKYNKQLSFRQQMMRDTAQAKYWQKLRGKDKILTPEKMKQYGSIFTMSDGEEIGLLQSNVLPPEMTSAIYSTEAALQRGSFPWALFGHSVGDMSSFTMSQVATAAHQVLAPYYLGYKMLVSDIDNAWIRMMKEAKVKPYGMKIPTGIPEGVEIECDYKLFIPGDVGQRATTMRMVSPNTELSDVTAIDMFFPEIGDPVAEIAKVRAGKALNSELASTAELVAAFREHARALRVYKKTIQASIYEKMADSLEQKLLSSISGKGNTQPANNTNQTGERIGKPTTQNPKTAGMPSGEGAI